MRLGDGGVFKLDAQFVQCLRRCPSASRRADLSDANMEPLMAFVGCVRARTCARSLSDGIPDDLSCDLGELFYKVATG